MDLVGRHVGEVWPVAPVQPDHGNLGFSQRRQQLLQRRDRQTVGRVVGAEMIDPAALGTEVVLHVDDDDGRALQVDGDVLRRGRELERSRLRRRRRHVDMAGAGAPFMAGARGAERGQDQDIGLRGRLAVGPQQVAAVTGSQPAGQIELGERE